MRFRLRSSIGTSAIALGAVGLLAPSAFTVPAASPVPAASTVPGAPSGVRGACPPPASRLQEQCHLLVGTGHPPARRSARGPRGTVTRDSASAPLVAADLRAAYGLGGAAAASPPRDVAVVAAYRDPGIAADFGRYRAMNGLAACAPATGAGCLTVLNQNGAASPLPAGTDTGWSDESALDAEMVAAICPHCHVTLLEASSASLTDLGAAVNSAAKVARFISNSWSGVDFPGESSYDTRYFNHPGVAIAFASGNYRYAAEYPASSQLVTSVGGTYLTPAATARGWSEVAWSGQTTGPGTGTQSGCSAGEAKPAWQSDPGCANRTQNDVAAVADAPYGVEFYSSSGDCAGICQGYGTSVATPIIAATYALAGVPKAGTYPAQYPYLRPGALYRVMSGSDGACEASRPYLCDAGRGLSDGYSGPAGWGTPHGTGAFAAPPGPASVVSVINPGSYDLRAGLSYRLPAIRAYDSTAGQRLTFAAAGLPPGMSIDPATGVISGTVPGAGPTAADVTVSVRDRTGAGSQVSFRIVGIGSLTASYQAGQGEVSLSTGLMCLDDRGGSSARTVLGALAQLWRCHNGPSQQWSFRPGGAPGDAGALMSGGLCLDVRGRGTAPGSRLQLWRCTGAGNQQWLITGSSGALNNPASGLCLDDAGGRPRSGAAIDIARCTGGTRQAWTLPASPVTSGVSGKCLDDLGGNSANGAWADSRACNGGAAQRFTLGQDGTIRIRGKCLSLAGDSADNQAPVQLWTCNGKANEVFQVSAWGMLESQSAQKCLAIPGSSPADGTRLVIADCYGDPGEIWAVSLRMTV